VLFAAASASAATVCRFASATSMPFGAYDVLSSISNDSQVDVTVTCDRSGGPQNTTMSLRVGQGLYGTSVNARRMGLAGGGDFLDYGLYRDAGRSSVWGTTDAVDTMQRSVTVPNNSSASTTFTIYGRIPALQNATVGSYFDSVDLTLIY
jgi:spore coat protein U-like protein